MPRLNPMSCASAESGEPGAAHTWGLWAAEGTVDRRSRHTNERHLGAAASLVRLVCSALLPGPEKFYRLRDSPLTGRIGLGVVHAVGVQTVGECSEKRLSCPIRGSHLTG
jgi:hypothetical protein